MNSTGVVVITFSDGALHNSVEVAGEFSNWKKIPLNASPDAFYSVQISNLKCEATYMYKFIIDDVWQLAQDGRPLTTDLDGNANHILTVPQADSFASIKIESIISKKLTGNSQKSVVKPHQFKEKLQEPKIRSNENIDKNSKYVESKLFENFTFPKSKTSMFQSLSVSDKTSKIPGTFVSSKQLMPVLNDPAVKPANSSLTTLVTEENIANEDTEGGNWITQFFLWLLALFSSLFQKENNPKTVIHRSVPMDQNLVS